MIVNSGSYAGLVAEVVKVSGSNAEDRRFRVSVCDGPTTWVDSVEELVPDALAEGHMVEVALGPYAGRLAEVKKVTTSEAGRRWRVSIDGGATTWVSAVKPASLKTLKRGSSKRGSEDFKAAKRMLSRGSLHSENIESLRPADYENVPWEKAQAMRFVDGGSGGVVLMDLEDLCIVLKKQSTSAAHEIFAEHLALACEVPVARCRIVRNGELEHGRIIEAGQRCSVTNLQCNLIMYKFFGQWKQDDASNTFVDGSVQGGIEVFGILEYIPGHTLMGRPGQRVLAQESSQLGALLASLGRLSALDVLMNNQDRIPLPVWMTAEGNMGNVMVADGASTVMGIDQQVNLIRSGPGLEAYLDRVRKLVFSLQPGMDAPGVAAKLRETLMNNCGTELSDDSVAEYQKGLREGMEAIAAVWKSGELAFALDKAQELTHDRLRDGATWRTLLLSHGQTDDLKPFVMEVAEAISDALA